jgi:hypothetical protein
LRSQPRAQMPGVLATGAAAEDVTVTPAVAQMMESVMQVAFARGTTQSRLVVGPRDAALRAARTCYDHLAGRLGVALADALVEGGRVELTSDGGMVTKAGVAFSAESASTSMCWRPAAAGARLAFGADHVSTGASDALT